MIPSCSNLPYPRLRGTREFPSPFTRAPLAPTNMTVAPLEHPRQNTPSRFHAHAESNRPRSRRTCVAPLIVTRDTSQLDVHHTFDVQRAHMQFSLPTAE